MSGVSRSSSENDPPGSSTENDPPLCPPGRSSGKSVLSPRSDKPVFQYRRWLDRLNKLFDDVYFVESPYMDPAVYEFGAPEVSDYKISIQTIGADILKTGVIEADKLGIAHDGNYIIRPQPCFFAPLPRQELHSHLIDLDFCDEITGDIRHELRVSSKILTNLGEGLESMASALFPGNHLSWLFAECPREGFREEGKTLTSLTPWRPSDPNEDIFEDYFRDQLFGERNPTWYPHEALRLPSSEGLPHTMFFLAHEIPGVEGKLLRGEVLAIVAAIKKRLSLPTLSSHPIIPVLVFLFMSNQYGRILQAVFNGTVIDISMTTLFDFRTPKTAESNFQTFLQYMAGQPIGTTTETLSVPVEESHRHSLGG